MDTGARTDLTSYKMMYPHAPVMRTLSIPKSQCGYFVKRHSSERAYCTISASILKWQGIKVKHIPQIKYNTSK
jgi:hypothetical protein